MVKKSGNYILFLALIIFTLTFIVDFAGRKIIDQVWHNKLVSNIENQVFDFEKKFSKLSVKLNDNFQKSGTTPPFNQITHYCGLRQLSLYIFNNNELLTWTDNMVLPFKPNPAEYGMFTSKVLNNGLYLYYSNKIDTLSYVILTPIKYNFPVENKYLENKIILNEKANGYFDIILSGEENNGISVYSSDNHYLFSLVPLDKQFPLRILAFFYVLSFILIFGWIHSIVGKLIKKNKIIQALIILLASYTVIYVFWKIIRYPKVIFNLELFSSNYYASSTLLSSLGDLVIFVFLLGSLLYFFINYFNLKKFKSKIVNKITILLLISMLLFSVLGLNYLIQGLIINSNISFDITNFYSLNFFSLLGFAIISTLVFYYLLISFKINELLDILTPLLNRKFLYITTVSIIFSLVLYLTGNFSFVFLIFPLLILIVFYFYQKEKAKSNYFFNYLLLILLISSVFTGIKINQFNHQKELDFKKLLAAQLLTEGDAVAEYLFNDLYEKILEDKFIKNFYQNPVLIKTYLSRRIEELYFTGYFNKYEIDIYTYSADGSPYKGNYDVPITYFTEIKKDQLKPVISNNLFFIENASGVPAYLAYIEIFKNGQHLGYLIIKLKQKIYFEESVYPELLLEGKELHRDIDDNRISYAVYSNKQITTQKGEYAYPHHLKYNILYPEPYHIMHDGDYLHMLHQLNPETFIVLTSKNKGYFYHLAVISAWFVFFALIALLFSLIRSLKINNILNLKSFWYIINPANINPLSNLLFRTKVQFSIIFAVLLALFVIGYSTINYLISDFNENEQNDLWKKSRLVLDRLQSKFNENPAIFSYNDELLDVTVKNLADVFRTDINLYSAKGNLITSSQMPIFESGVISTKMTPEAFYEMGILKQSHYLTTEQISKLVYLASYLPVRNNRNELVAILQLPYFAKQAELESQVSTLLSTLTNLYVFLFLLVSLVSIAISNTLTRPLKLIRDKLRKTEIGKINEPINWKGNDEIGQLIQEYNLMLNELEKSAENLARSEREGAWREMAKQVAHEIKNPLTPMKLNIQHIQKAWKENDPELNNKFEKVTTILIDQIESLSQIATEFSAFAQMPSGKPEEVNITEVITNISRLYEQSSKANIIANFEKNTTATVFIDKDQLSRVFNNILKNAIQSIPENETGEIRISINLNKDQVTTEVKDNGKGIPDEIKDKIFSPNFSTKSSGMGMGLAICNKIITQAKGHIDFETIKGEGTSIYISLPLYNKP